MERLPKNLREPQWLLDIVAGGEEDGNRLETFFLEKTKNLVILFFVFKDVEEADHFHVIIS